MGHENCGVVQAATRPLAILSNEPPQLAKMLLSVSDKLARSAAEINTFVEGPDRLTAAIIANARAQAAMVVAMPGVAARVETGELMVVHAYYQVSTGKVHFFAPKAPIELPPLPPPRSFLPFCGRGVVDASVLAPGVKTTLKPNQILSEFKEGNARFWTGESAQHTTVQGHNQRLGFAERPGVLPKAMVLGCADSRVPVEMVFDQPVGTRAAHAPAVCARAARRPRALNPTRARPSPSLAARAGEIFVARNAGNLHTEHTAGSAEYAVVHLGVKLIVVLGHQACGAVKAAQLPTKDIKGMPENLAFTLLDMKDGLKYCMYTLENMSDPKARDRESVVANAQVQVRKLSAEPGLRAKVHSGELLIVAAVYDLTSGIVDFF
jgi:carbonic anhydrase